MLLQSLSKDSALLQLFGLSEDEQVVEQFPCKMLQTVGWFFAAADAARC